MVVPLAPVTVGVNTLELLKLVAGDQVTEVALGATATENGAFCLQVKLRLEPKVRLAGQTFNVQLAGVPTQDPVVPVTEYTVVAVGDTTMLDDVAPVLHE